MKIYEFELFLALGQLETMLLEEANIPEHNQTERQVCSGFAQPIEALICQSVPYPAMSP
jgi:hypothetical protein